jgi:hypothetical protein
MGRSRNNLRRGALHLFKLGHQVRFGVQAAGGIHDHCVGSPGFRGGHGVKDDRGGVSAGFLLDDFDAVALCPDFQLFDRGGTKRVGSAKHDAAAVLAESIGEFADTGGLAGAVDTDDKNHPWIIPIGRGGQLRSHTVNV